MQKRGPGEIRGLLLCAEQGNVVPEHAVTRG